jgi:hypothetical protein
VTSSSDGVLASVVMIFRNAEPFLVEAIDSVLAQTHPALELLLCDDGSSTAAPRSPYMPPGKTRTRCATWSTQGMDTWE